MAKKPAKEKQDPEVDSRFVAVVDAFAADPAVTAGRMMASFGLKVNEKIFAMVVKGMLVVKLPKARVDEMVGGGAGEHLETSQGKRMKEWIAVRGDTGWVELAKEAYGFVKAGTV